MSRLIDADEFKAFNARWMANEKDPDKKRARETRTQLFNTFIDMQKTIDAVPVVRCKDCTYCSHFTDGHLECRLLYNLKPVPTTYCQMEENDFCSYGVRKGEQTT